MKVDSVCRMYGVDCPAGGGHVIRIGKVFVPPTATVEDLHLKIAEQKGVTVADLSRALEQEQCEIHNQVVQFTADKVRFVDDSENPPNQSEFVSS